MTDSQEKSLSIVTPAELNAPQIKVVEDGKEVVRPDVIAAVTQLASLAQLVKIRKSLEKEGFEGKEDPRTFSATGTIQYISLIHDYPYTPWATAYFYNDDPSNAVYISINNPWDWNEIKSGEDSFKDRLKADKRIELVYYKCDPGGTASVRVVGKY